MKKFFVLLGLFIILNISTFYVLLFTPVGNGIVAPIIEENVNKKNIVNLKIEEFNLDTSTLKLVSNINNEKITIDGNINIFDLSVDLKYDVKINNLSNFAKLTKQKLNGKLYTSGTIKGNKQEVYIKGISNIANSNTTYKITLNNFKPQNIDFDISKAKIEEVLFMVNQPQYINGFINSKGNVENVKLDKLDGKIVTKIYEIATNNDIIKEKINLYLSEIVGIRTTINTNLKPFKIENNADIYTTIGNLFLKDTNINLKDNSISSNYLLKIDDLNNLKDFTKKALNGKLVLTGDIIKSKKLIVSGNSKILNGHVKFNMIDNDIKVNMSNIEIEELTNMLMYPSVFNSKANLDINFNLKNKNGNIKANLINGHFVNNHFSSLINTFTKFDITKEIYQNVLFDSKINNNIINSNLTMNSSLTTININNSILDTKEKIINSTVDVKIKDTNLKIDVNGEIYSPKISVNTNEVIKEKIKRKAKEKITNDLGKKIDEKLGNDIGSNILKSFFE
jgi:hypothetical protein